MKLPKSLTPERILDAVERGATTLDDPGFCLACGAEAHGVEPDAEDYECESCGEHRVWGAEQIMFTL
jgi:predicted RNA-binding Zn-ribbon protein involved in translation (DUF1610 family)